MQSEPDNRPPPPEARQRRYENSTPAIRWIVAVAVMVIALMGGSQVVVWLVAGRLAQSRPLDQTIQSRGILTAPNQQMLERFPGPKLQVDAHEDLVALRKREDAELNSYGWIDRSNGVVRIPITQAMDLLVQRGLPTRNTNVSAAIGKSPSQLIWERSQQR